MKQFFLSLLIFFAVNASAGGPVKLTLENSVLLFGEINMISIMLVENDLLMTLKETTGPVYLIIHSPGGAASPVVDAYPFFSSEPRLNVVVVMAASGGAAISQMVKGHRILVPKSKMLFHRVKTYFMQPVNATELEEHLKKLRAMDNQFANICSAKLSISPRKYREKVAKDDWVLDANQAVKVGAGTLLPVECDTNMREANILVPTYDSMIGLPVYKNFCDLLN